MLGAPTVNCNRQVGIGSTPTANLKHYKPPSLRSEALPSDYEPLSERKLFLLRDYKRPSECAGLLLRDNKRQSECARFLLIGNRRPLGRKVHHPKERGRPRPHLWLARMPVFPELAEKIRKNLIFTSKKQSFLYITTVISLLCLGTRAPSPARVAGEDARVPRVGCKY
jgi:hypothetical protein